MKIAVLTSSIGSTKLLDPIPFDGVDYHAFVDYASDVKGWIKHPTVPFSVDTRYKNRRDAKVYKILPFAFLPDYDYYFWIDSTHILEADPCEIIDTYLKDSDIAVFKHPERDCVYIEGNFVQMLVEVLYPLYIWGISFYFSLYQVYCLLNYLYNLLVLG